MPLYWIINSRAELVTRRRRRRRFGQRCHDVLAHLVRREGHGLRRLFDGRNGASSMTEQELLMIIVEVRSHHSLGKVGALAVVSNS